MRALKLARSDSDAELLWESPDGKTVAIPYPGNGARTAHHGVPCVEAIEYVGGKRILYRIYDPSHEIKDTIRAGTYSGVLKIEKALAGVTADFICTLGLAGTFQEATFGFIPHDVAIPKDSHGQVFAERFLRGMIEVATIDRSALFR